MTHLGLIGLGTMGENLVRNIISRDESIVVWNRSLDKVDALVAETGNAIIKAETIADLIKKTESPRNIILLVPAGKVTTEVAQELFEILSPGDAIWDLGNAHWDVTLANQAEALKHGIHWVGCGISGGSEGARLGPALMPGGDEETVRRMLPLLEKIAAKDFAGKPCVTYVGQAAAGNFVKMVHNGIEYAIMQGIAEIYDILRSVKTSQAEMKTIFEQLNTGLLKSFLLDITVDILGTKDSDGTDLLEKISDIAGSKGTGGWTVEAALKLGVPVPTIAESLFARWLSGRKEKVVKTLGLSGHFDSENIPSTEKLRAMLTLVYLGVYIQGMGLILGAESEWNWGIGIDEVFRIWQGGCIIRSNMLEVLPDFYHEKQSESCLEFMDSLPILQIAADELLSEIHTPIPVGASVVQYFKALSADKLPTNLIQAMRDSFGAHGVKRIGSDVSESFQWK